MLTRKTKFTDRINGELEDIIVLYQLRYRVYGENYDRTLDYDYDIQGVSCYYEDGDGKKIKVRIPEIKELANKHAHWDANSYLMEQYRL